MGEKLTIPIQVNGLCIHSVYNMICVERRELWESIYIFRKMTHDTLLEGMR